jgi:hypothetical protein
MQARIKLQNTKLSKSGLNKFAGYAYFELGDFLPTIQQIFTELDLCGVVSYTAELATLTICHIDSPETTIVITSPMGSAALKGCHEVQNIGAVESYQRRYLWMTALEIVEHDVLDATTGSDKVASKVRPNISGEEFWNNADEEEKKFLDGCLSDIRDLLNADNAKDAAAYFYGMKDQEEALAVWSQLGSKERSSIKNFKPAKE